MLDMFKGSTGGRQALLEVFPRPGSDIYSTCDVVKWLDIGYQVPRPSNQLRHTPHASAVIKMEQDLRDHRAARVLMSCSTVRPICIPGKVFRIWMTIIAGLWVHPLPKTT
jgi:hypothetical protein